MLKPVSSDGQEGKRSPVTSGRAAHHGEGTTGCVELAVELDFPETIIGARHESADRVTIICGIVGRDSRNSLLKLLGFIQKLGVSQIEHSPVGDRGPIRQVDAPGGSRFPRTNRRCQTHHPASLDCKVPRRQSDDPSGGPGNTGRPEFWRKRSRSASHNASASQFPFGDFCARIERRVHHQEF
jgi:hypothetical protein